MTSTTVDVNELSEVILEKSFYPNPVASKALLKLTSRERMINPQLQVLDIMSKKIFSLNIEKDLSSNSIEFNFDCSKLPDGIYYYMVSDLNKIIYCDKFMVVHD